MQVLDLSHVATEDRPKLVSPIIPKDKKNTSGLTKSEQKLVDGYKAMLYKLAYHKFPSVKHVGTRVAELNTWMEKFRTGYPWKNNQRLVSLATPQLVAAALALSSRLETVEKAKLGRDIGKVDG